MTSVAPRIVGIADEIVRGDAPIATGRFVEKLHPNIDRLLPEPGAVASSFALHLDPAGIEPVTSAREAGRLVSRRAAERAFGWPLGSRGEPDPRFPLHAALQAQDGQWYVARMRATVEGAEVPNQQLAYYRILGGDPTLTRTVPELRLVGVEGVGFPFRHAVDEVGARRPGFSPEGFLGDGYQPTLVDAHLDAARAALDDTVRDLEAVVPSRGLPGLRPGRVEGADLFRFGRSRASVHNSLDGAHSELQRLLPDEQGSAVVGGPLRDQVRQLADAVEAARAAASEVPHWQLRETVDMPLLRAHVQRLAGRVRELPSAPRLDTAGADAAASQLPEFAAMVARLRSGSFLARADTMRVFGYEKFGRTPAERLRNVGIALESLEARVGFGDRGVHRLKAWLRDLAVDAGRLRDELGPEHAALRTLLGQVEDHARRNGRPGVVVNAAGRAGYEDFPDYAEVGAMGAALRTYIAVDDAGRLAAAQAPTPPPGYEVLTW